MLWIPFPSFLEGDNFLCKSSTSISSQPDFSSTSLCAVFNNALLPNPWFLPLPRPRGHPPPVTVTVEIGFPRLQPQIFVLCLLNIFFSKLSRGMKRFFFSVFFSRRITRPGNHRGGSGFYGRRSFYRPRGHLSCSRSRGPCLFYCQFLRTWRWRRRARKTG